MSIFLILLDKQKRKGQKPASDFFLVFNKLVYFLDDNKLRENLKRGNEKGR